MIVLRPAGHIDPAPRKAAPAHIQWAFVDLDGTLLRPDQKISHKVLDSVRRLRDRVPVSIATGRERLETIRFASDLGLTAPQICDGGAAIFGMPEGHMEWSLPLETPAVKAVIAELQSVGARFFATHPEGAYTNLLSPDVAELPWVTTDPAAAQGIEFTRISALDLSQSGATTLAATIGRRLSLNTARAYLPYNGMWAVDFTHCDANKGTAAARAAAMAGVELDNCVAIGDSYNDLPMLRACGLAIAMEGAPREVLLAAQHVVPSVHVDGLSTAIDEIVMPLL